MKPRRILVTGGAGFIGCNLVALLLRQGHSVLNIDCLSYAANLSALDDFEKNPSHTFLKADICDELSISRAVADFSPDWMFHLAAESHVDRSILQPLDFLKTNVLGTGVMLNAALAYWRSLSAERGKDFRFVHVSTDEVFGALGSEGCFTESSPYDPQSPYSASKAASDHMVRAWGNTYGLPTLITNGSNNYGPFQFSEKLIPHVISRAFSGQKIPVYGKGLQIRDWIHVMDHCEALALIAERGRVGETYLIGGDNEWRNIDLVEKLCRLLKEMLDVDAEIEFVRDRPGHDFRYAVDSSKLRDELAWLPQRDFESGLRETLLWYRQQWLIDKNAMRL
jgi:dTDP-glucose 4,6-dehydratase